MKDKNVAAIFAFFFGIFGVHRFYLGQTGRGILHLVFLPVFMITGIIALVDAIILFSMDKDEFDYKYNQDYISSDYRRHNTDFNRHERRFRQEEEYRLEQQRRREARKAQYRKPPTSPKVKSNPYKVSGVNKFKEFDYEGAIEDFKKALAVEQKDVAVHFNLACAYSLSEEGENAFFHLDKAVAYGFVDFKKIQEHDALAYLRIQNEFEDFKKNGYRISGSKEEHEDVVVTSDNLLEQIKELGELREKGFLTQEEFEKQKKKLLR